MLNRALEILTPDELIRNATIDFKGNQANLELQKRAVNRYQRIGLLSLCKILILHYTIHALDEACINRVLPIDAEKLLVGWVLLPTLVLLLLSLDLDHSIDCLGLKELLQRNVEGRLVIALGELR